MMTEEEAVEKARKEWCEQKEKEKAKQFSSELSLLCKKYVDNMDGYVFCRDNKPRILKEGFMNIVRVIMNVDKVADITPAQKKKASLLVDKIFKDIDEVMK